MDSFAVFIEEILTPELIRVVVSNPKVKGDILKVKVRPIERKAEILYQFESFTGTQVFHKNLFHDEAKVYLTSLMEQFKQMQVSTSTFEAHVLVSKKGKYTINKKNKSVDDSKDIASAPDLSHNRKKQYLLEEGKLVPFLVDLGIMSKEGKIIQSKYDKFRQINRYLEFVADVLPEFSHQEMIRIIDFGCGKSYLTFALYHYLYVIKGYRVQITGLDLKQDVIHNCNRLANSYGYKYLQFQVGDIATYTHQDIQVDMVISLHACDTATDYALEKAIRWGAKIIFAVPCCQHELHGQIDNVILAPILRYGLLKERFASIVTDALRAEYLEAAGYQTQILEFIDMEHTPKNLLIRAVKREHTRKQDLESRMHVEASIQQMNQFLHTKPKLGSLLVDDSLKKS